MILKFQFFARFSNFSAFILFWLGIWYELVNSMDLGFKMNWSIVWVIMGRRGVSSECRRSSCSSVSCQWCHILKVLEKAGIVQIVCAFNPLHAKSFRGNIKHIFSFHVIPLLWYDTGGWNPSSNKTMTYPFYIVNIIAPGGLATQGARTSAAMILT